MTGRRSLLAAFLIYVTLDLSLAAMPGAFVFEPADSVDATHRGRAGETAEVATPPAMPSESLEIAPPRREPRAEPVSASERTHRRVLARGALPRAVVDAAPGSEDPH